MWNKKEKRNPVLDIQEHMEKEGVVFGKMEYNGQVESNSKLSYAIVEHIYELGNKLVKQQTLKDKLVFLGIGFVAGLFIIAVIRIIIGQPI